MTVYTYTRYSPKNRELDSQLEALAERFPEAQAIQDRVKGRVPALEREQFSKLFDSLQPGDTLALWWLNALAPDFKHSHELLSQLLEKKVTLQTLSQELTFEPDSVETKVLLCLLKGYADAEKQHRLFAAEMGRRALKGNPDAWKEKFRGRPANREKHQHIATLLLEGKTLQQVADETETSLSTVKRVKSKVIEHDESGSLRRRARHGAGGGRGRHGGGRHHHGRQRGQAMSEE